jgi:hypothetical protein
MAVQYDLIFLRWSAKEVLSACSWVLTLMYPTNFMPKSPEMLGLS